LKINVSEIFEKGFTNEMGLVNINAFII